MKKITTLLLSLVILLSLVACDNKMSLIGEWEQSNKNSEENYQSAVITEDTITIFWVNEGTESLYWAGSYDNSNTSFTSNNDFEQTDSALLASGADTKEFIVKGDILSYEVSAMGVTTTVELEKINK